MNLGCLPNSFHAYSATAHYLCLGGTEEQIRTLAKRGNVPVQWCHIMVTWPHHPKFISKMLLIPWTLHNKIFPIFSSISSNRNEHKVTWEINIGLVFPHEWTSIFCNGSPSALLPYIQSATVIGHTSAALWQDLSPKHPKPAIFTSCSKTQNTTDRIIKDHLVLRVAKESCCVKAIKSADRFSALWSYEVINSKYNQSCRIHSTLFSQLGNWP